MAIQITHKPVSQETLYQLLLEIDTQFTVPLSERVGDLRAYADKLVAHGEHIWACDGQKIAGWAVYYANDTQTKRAHLSQLVVLPAYRRQGLAARMLDQILIQAAKQEMTTLTLDVFEQSSAAIALYIKKGFCTIGKEGNLLTMERPLSNAQIH